MEILPFLYLGSALHASKKEVLDAMGISALLNVSADCPNHFEGVYQYKCIPVEDNHKEDISCWFLEAIEFIGQRSCVLVCVWQQLFAQERHFLRGVIKADFYFCKFQDSVEEALCCVQGPRDSPASGPER